VGTIAVASAKGSPGVTTAVAALAATWPVERELVVVEVDPSGGDLAVRFDLAPEPGLVSLAAAGRRELRADTLREHTQDLTDGSAADVLPRRVLVAPVSADQAVASLTALRGALPAVLADLGCDVLVDCGRLEPQSPTFEVATKADLLVVVARPVVAEVHHLSARLASLRANAVSLLLVGERPYSVSEVAEAVGANPLGTLPADARSAAALAGGHRNAARALRRSALLRDAGAIADGLAAWLGPVPGAEVAPAPAGAPGATGPAAAPTPGPAAPAEPGPTDPVGAGAAAGAPPVEGPPPVVGPPPAPATPVLAGPGGAGFPASVARPAAFDPSPPAPLITPPAPPPVPPGPTAAPVGPRSGPPAEPEPGPPLAAGLDDVGPWVAGPAADAVVNGGDDPAAPDVPFSRLRAGRRSERDTDAPPPKHFRRGVGEGRR